MKKAVSLIIIIISLCSLIVWQIFAENTNYYLVCAVILILSVIPFFVSFERSNPSAREIALISSLVAIAVVSRAAFYLVPQVKPIGAVVIISGVCLGSKRGYLIGALSAFISNFIFGQGMWTPFQMVALGTVGLIAGLVFKKIKAKRLILSVVGFILCFAVYAIIVDLSSVLMFSQNPTLPGIVAIYTAGIPFNLVFGISTAVFLFISGEAFVKKVNRIIRKYGIV